MINRKGASIDNIYVVVAFFGLMIFILAVLVFWNAAYGINNFWSQTTVGTAIRNSADRAYGTMDFNLVLMYVALHLGILIVAAMLKSSPVMYVVSIFLIIALTLLAVPISNAWEEIITDTNLVSAASEIPMANYIMNRLPYFEIVWSLITLIFLYGLSRWEGFL